MSYSILPTILDGYGGEALFTTFIRQHAETDHLAIVFPGMAYTAHMPVLYYASVACLYRGADVLELDAMVRSKAFQQCSPDAQYQWLIADAETALTWSLHQRAYRRITCIGKSLGTLALGYLLTHPATHQIPQQDYLWLTPLLRNEQLCEQLTRMPHHGHIVIGTADLHYDEAVLAQVSQQLATRPLVLEGANHSLEQPGNMQGSLRLLMEVTESIEAFLAHDDHPAP